MSREARGLSREQLRSKYWRASKVYHQYCAKLITSKVDITQTSMKHRDRLFRRVMRLAALAVEIG